MVAHCLGIKVVGFAAVTNKGSGLSDEVHDGEANLIAAKKCLENLTKTIIKIVEKFEL